MSYAKAILTEMEKGRNDGVSTIPIGHPKLGEHIVIGKQLYTLIGGNSGTGKTSFTDCTYVLDPYEWYLKNKDKTDIKLEIIYRSMERPKPYKLGKWACMKLYTDYNILLDVPTLYGWGSKKNHISEETYQLICKTLNYFDKMEEVVKVIDGSENPTGVYNQLVQNAKQNGSVVQKSEFEKEYVPNDNKKITLVVVDHIGKLRRERGYSKKEGIDKMSEYLGIARDFYGYSPVVVSQFNRNLSDSQRARNKELTPDPDDFKDTGNLYEDADVALALFNPFKFKVFDHMEYDIAKFVNHKGYNRFRSVTALKNSYGIDDFRIGYGFVGEIGLFKEIPRANEMTHDVYANVRDLNKNVVNLIV